MFVTECQILKDSEHLRFVLAAMTQIRGHAHLLLPVLVACGNDQVSKPYNMHEVNQQCRAETLPILPMK